MKFHVKMDPKRDKKAVMAAADCLGGIIEIKEFDECVEIHTDYEWVRGEVEDLREHFRQETG